MNRTEYLNTLTEQIENKNVRELIQSEIAAHIEDQKEAYLSAGMEEKEAEEQAVNEMGDPVDAGIRLNKVHRPKTDQWMVAGILILTVVGIVMQIILFAGWDNAKISGSYPVRTILYNLAGFVVIAFVSLCDYRLIEKYILLLYPVYLLCGFVSFRIIGSWNRMLLAGQMLNMAFVPLFAAFVYYFRGERWKGIFKSLGLLFVNMFLLLLIGCYTSGTMLISAAVCMITMIAAAAKGIFGGNHKKQAGILTAVFVGIPALFIGDILIFDGKHLFMAAYQIKRIQVLFNPEAFADSEGYITTTIRSQISAAGLIGGGDLGRLGELNGCWSDYVLACLTSYFGILAAALVVFIIAAFMVRSLHVSVKQKNRLGFLIGISCSSLLILKTAVYMAMNFGIGPVIGIDMPFLTFGFSNTMMNALFIGLIFAVYRNTNLLPEPKGEKVRLRLRLEKAAERNM